MARSKQPIPLEDLHLPAPLHKKLIENFQDTARLRMLRPAVLISEWKLTRPQWDRLNAALASRGQVELGDYVEPEKQARGANMKGKCRKPVEIGVQEPLTTPCLRPLLEGKRSCMWHWLEGQPIELQTEWADQRRGIAERAEGYAYRARVPQAEWLEGTRWCSECQTMIPVFYCTGSRCKAHASRAAHASLTKRLYDFTREDYEALLAWQKGRCYICQQLPHKKRLAVDHDHRTMLVRGLLCASDEWGCNMTLRRLLNSPAMARRALEYVTKTPLERMQAGEEPVTIDQRSQVTRTRAQADDPFAGF
jgi:hypothetical protein